MINLQSLVDNQTLIGLVGATITASILYALKEVPRLIWSWIKWSTTVKIHIRGEDDAYQWVTEWLAKHKYTLSARRVKISANSETGDITIEPGFGRHLIWEGLTPIWIERLREDKPVTSSVHAGAKTAARMSESYSIVFLGRSQVRARNMLNKITGQFYKERGLDVKIWNGWWDVTPSRALRPLSSIFTNENMHHEVLEDALEFFQNERWYVERGIPYHRGYLFCGPPGTGKTSLVKALASHLHRPLCYLRINSVEDDRDLLNAFVTAPKNAIILLEDIDTLKVTHDRDKLDESSDLGQKAAHGVSLGGLLNTLDGVVSVENRLVIMTTNQPQKLDPALMRPGRIDRSWCFEELKPQAAYDMVKVFRPHMSDEDIRELVSDKCISAAEWQKILMQMYSDDKKNET